MRIYVGPEGGFTLVETLVAMALFASALLPLMASLGMLMQHSASDRYYAALSEAENDLASIGTAHDIQEVERSLPHGLTLKRTVHREKRLVIVDISILDTKKHNPVVSIEKSLLIPR